MNVDVNVHPTKHEVHFLHEETVVATIANSIEAVLQGSNHSRTFFIQSLLPGATAAETNTVIKQKQSRKNNNNCLGEPSLSQRSNKSESSTASESSSVKWRSDNTYQKDMVRTDKNLQKLDKFFMSSTPLEDKSSSSGLESFRQLQFRC